MQLPYFFEPDIIAQNGCFTLSETSSRHSIQVLRMKKGEALQLTDGKGHLFTATISNNDKKHCEVKISHYESNPPQAPHICLAVAPVKNASRLEWMIEKATEIGVNEIVLLQTQRTEKHHHKQERITNIVISAMLQSRQTWLPQLQLQADFTTFISSASTSLKLIAHCLPTNSKQSLFSFQQQSSTILIGPEGDFTEEEIEITLQKNFVPVSLGATRLRTETAAIVAASLLKNLR